MAFDAVRDLLEHLGQGRVDVDGARDLACGEVEALRQHDLAVAAEIDALNQALASPKRRASSCSTARCASAPTAGFSPWRQSAC